MRVLTTTIAIALGAFCLTAVPEPADAKCNVEKLQRKAEKLRTKVEAKGVTPRLAKKIAKLQRKVSKCGFGPDGAAVEDEAVVDEEVVEEEVVAEEER